MKTTMMMMLMMLDDEEEEEDVDDDDDDDDDGWRIVMMNGIGDESCNSTTWEVHPGYHPIIHC